MREHDKMLLKMELEQYKARAIANFDLCIKYIESDSFPAVNILTKNMISNLLEFNYSMLNKVSIDV